LIALLVFTAGDDDRLAETLASADERLVGPIVERVIYDDSGDPEHSKVLVDAYPDFDVVSGSTRFGAVRTAWEYLRVQCRAPFVFHLEDGYTFERPVALIPMAHALETHPYLCQMALRPAEVEVSDDFAEIVWHPTPRHSFAWLEHRRWFTTEPSLYRRSLCSQSWPRGANGEGRFTHQLLRSPKVRFGYWGAATSAPLLRREAA
jgi:hypothetical protein